MGLMDVIIKGVQLEQFFKDFGGDELFRFFRYYK
jgi:hypothetical protein